MQQKYNVLQYAIHTMLVPINCHFWCYKVHMVTSLTQVPIPLPFSLLIVG